MYCVFAISRINVLEVLKKKKSFFKVSFNIKRNFVFSSEHLTFSSTCSA